MIADYKTSRQIADELFVSTKTVQTHRANICLKLDVHGSHALMRFALEHKLELLMLLAKCSRLRLRERAPRSGAISSRGQARARTRGAWPPVRGHHTPRPRVRSHRTAGATACAAGHSRRASPGAAPSLAKSTPKRMGHNAKTPRRQDAKKTWRPGVLASWRLIPLYESSVVRFRPRLGPVYAEEAADGADRMDELGSGLRHPPPLPPSTYASYGSKTNSRSSSQKSITTGSEMVPSS